MGSRNLMLQNSDSEERNLYYQKFRENLIGFIQTIPSSQDGPYNWEILKSNIELEDENFDEFNQRVLVELAESSRKTSGERSLQHCRTLNKVGFCYFLLKKYKESEKFYR